MKRKRVLLFFFVTLAFLFALSGLLVSFFLPRFLENLAQEQARKLGANLVLRVHSVGLHHLALGNILLGTEETGTLSADSIVLTYDLIHLKEKGIQSLTLSGLDASVSSSDDRFRLHGLPQLKGDTNRNGERTTFTLNDAQQAIEALPLPLKKIIVSKSVLHLHLPESSFHVPIEGSIGIDQDHLRLESKISALVQNKALHTKGSWDLKQNTFTATIQSEGLPISSTSLAFVSPPLQFQSIATLNGSVSGTIFPFSALWQGELDLTSPDARFADVLHLSSNQTQPASAVQLTFSGELQTAQPSLKKAITVSPFFIQKPFPASLKDSTVDLSLTEKTLQGWAKTTLTFFPPTSQQSASDSSCSMPLQLSFTASENNWSVQAGTVRPISCAVRQANIVTQVDGLSSSFSSSGDMKQATFSLNSNIQKVDARQESETGQDVQMTTSELFFNLQGTMEDLSTTGVLHAETSLTGDDLHVRSAATEAQADIAYRGIMQVDFQKPLSETQMKGTVSLENSRIVDADKEFEAQDILLTLPLHLPLNDTEKTTTLPPFGHVKVGKILFKKRNLGELNGTITPHNFLYDFTGRYTGEIFDDLSADLNGTIDYSQTPPHMALAVQTSETTIHSDMPFLSTLVADVDYSGKIMGQLALTSSLEGFAAEGALHLSEFDIHKGSDDIDITDLTLDLPIQSLQPIRSGTAQLLFATADIGDLHFGPGKASFQLESPDSFFVERSTIQWAGGSLDLLGTRIHTTNKTQELTIYCNGLNLADLLGQLGISSVSGSGKVNGKIPVAFDKEHITFDGAFLYSTPGTGGNIHLDKGDILLAGIPKNSVQFAQLDFARSALKNFSYDWVTLDLQSSTTLDDAVLTMKLDGKPASPLPFRYEPRAGTFVRTQEGKPGINYPIKLDVNFHLPLNKMMRYGKGLKGFN